MFSFFWVIFSYLLGSIPFGFLISQFSGKDILKIGWKKTSGSNVFKNVGKWQGVLTGLLDIAKGYAAVYGAQKLGLSSEIQVFSGVAAVTGHNWSLFLKFAGGRGIGTFAGALIAMHPLIFGIALIILALLTLIWNASIGTILALAVVIFLSIRFNQFETVGFFGVISLAPIFIKRLSPIKEINKSQNKLNLIKNRLLFDNDKALISFRIKRIIEGEKNNPSRINKIIKPLSKPLLFPPRVGWKAAKFGAKIAKKPIEKLIFRQTEKIVTEIKTEDFKKMMTAAAKKIVIHQEEINKINVFPVADKDTGYNLAATLLGIEGTISRRDYSSFQELTKDIGDAAMINARGNAGMIYTGYLIKILDEVKNLESINAFHLSLAMKRAIKSARLSIIDPVEGTILDVIKAAGEESYNFVKFKKEKNIIKILEAALKVSQETLKETKEKLQVLKENDVVDAGALGFVKILEAWIESLKGILPPVQELVEISETIQPEGTEEKLKFPYEVIFSFKKNQKIEKEELKKELSALGDSLDIIESEEKIKIHVHTDKPEIIKEKYKNLPEVNFRIENMEKQKMIISKKELGLVVDEIADLPKEFLEKYKIEEVPIKARFPNGEIVSSKEDIYLKMKESLMKGEKLPTTSAPSFNDFLSAYKKALEKFKKILVITASSKLSGTYSSARIARSIFKKPKKLDIYVFDTFTGEVAEGLIVARTQELISQGKNMEEIVEELKTFCPKVVLFGYLKDYQYVVHGGRVKLPKLLIKPLSLIQRIGINPLIMLKNGKVGILGLRLGRNIDNILTKEIKKQTSNSEIKVAIAHADNLELAQKLRKEIEKKLKAQVMFISSISPVVGVHTGPGAVLIAFYPIDK